MSSGFAMAPIFFATWSLSRAAIAGVASTPSFSVTNAAIAWPLISCALPTTAASATSG